MPLANAPAVLSVRLPAPARDRLKAAAAARGETVQGLVGALVERFLTEDGRRAPELAPFMLMPVIGDQAVLRTRPGVRRDAISLAGTVGLLNSTLLALAGGLLVGSVVTGWVPVAGAIVIFALAYAGQLRYVRVAMRTCSTEIADLIRDRGLLQTPGDHV